MTYKNGDKIVWYESRKWGGKQAQPSTFRQYRGKSSALITVGDPATGPVKVVRVASIVPAGARGEGDGER